jgi:hypothetical protein
LTAGFEGEDSKAKYSVDYLTKMLAIRGLKRIRFATDYPCQLEYELDSFDLKIILAPRIDND